MAVQHANRGIVKKNLQLYYNREWIKSFRGEAVTNYVGALTANHESAVSYWVSTVTKDTSTGYTAFKVVPLAGGYQASAGYWVSCGIIAGNGGFQPPGTYSLSAKVLLPKDSVYTFGFRAYPSTEEFAVNVTGTGSWQTIKRENFTSVGYNYLQFQMIRLINGTTGGSSPIYPGDPFWVRDIVINSGSYAKPFASMANELSARPENTTNITTNGNFASSISGTDSGGTQNGWTFSSWSGSGNAYATQASTAIYTSTTTSFSTIPLRVTRTSAGSMDYFSTTWNTLSNGTVYTISFWARSGGATTSLDITHQNLGIIKTYSIDPNNGWYKYSATFTHAGGTQYPYLRHAGSNGTWIEIANVQLEAKSYPTDFTATNRTNIANTAANGGGLIDISGNGNNADLTNVSFNSSGYTFSGSANYIDLPASTFLDFNFNNFSIFTWINSSATANFGNIFNNFNTAGTLGFQFLTKPSNGGCRVWIGNVFHDNTVNVTNGSWNYIGFVRNGDYVYFYVNGSLSSTGTGFAAKNATPDSGNDRRIGRQTTNTSYDFNGQISNFKIYSKELTSAEVSQNFNATRKNYGI
jgi:hypothetical protein